MKALVLAGGYAQIALIDELKRRGILVRHFNSPRICQYNRITIGSLDQMKRLIKTVSDILGGN